MTHLQLLESEAIYVIREACAELQRPVLLFSGGKDSTVLLHLARKAFWPTKIPFPIMHIDTGHNFPEALQFRDDLSREFGLDLIIRKVEDSIQAGRVQDESGPNPSRNALQTVTLLDAIKEFDFDAVFGGARRDEEKARAKERFFSHRNKAGQWDPKNQRPELWHLFNTKLAAEEHFRVFPLSNWTELDIWQYILKENLKLPSLYFAHSRQVLQRQGAWLAKSDYITLNNGEKFEEKIIRFRTVGDATCTGAVLSKAANVPEVIAELLQSKVSERSTRVDDKRSDSAMEDRKRTGYF